MPRWYNSTGTTGDSITTSGTWSTGAWTSWTATTSVTTWNFWIDTSTRIWSLDAPAAETDEQKAERLRVQADASERAKREREEVEVRAKALLRLVVGDEEYARWEEHRHVRVQGALGVWVVGSANALYLIPASGEPTRRMCCHAPNHFCAEDRVAAMVLELQHDEAAVLRKGNPLACSPEQREATLQGRYVA